MAMFNICMFPALRFFVVYGSYCEDAVVDHEGSLLERRWLYF